MKNSTPNLKKILSLAIITINIISCASKSPNISGMHIQNGSIGNIKNINHYNIELMATIKSDTIWENKNIEYDSGRSKSHYEFLNLPVLPILLFSSNEEKNNLFFGFLGLSPSLIYQNSTYNLLQPKIWMQFSSSKLFGGVGLSSNPLYNLLLGIGSTYREATAYGEGGFLGRDIVGHELEFRIVTDATYDFLIMQKIIQLTSQIEFNKNLNQRVFSSGINIIF